VETNHVHRRSTRAVRGMHPVAVARQRGGGAIRTAVHQLGRHDVASSQIDAYLAALKENGAASVHEPGCRTFNIAVSQKDPNHVFVFEVYDNAAAFDAHLQTDHFKKYAATTKDMVAKRDPHPLSLVAAYAKGK
jgi:autoinducer 2-degrading protein